MGRRAWLVVAALAAGCGDDTIEVRQPERGAYRRDDVLAAVGKYASGPRTPEAFGVLAREIAALRPTMDEPVAALAELQLTVLAVDAVESVQTLPWHERTARLATTVWPLALAPELVAREPDGWQDPDERGAMLKDGETPDAYVARLCTEAFVVECKHVVPEWQGAVLGTIAVGNLAERARAAVQDCDACAAEPRWADAVKRWEKLDAIAQTERVQADAQGATDRWPVAGPGAQPWTRMVRLDIEDDGDWLLEGALVAPTARVDALAGRRSAGATLAVHLAPEATVATLDAAIAAAGQAGFTHVAVEARVPEYPWALQLYTLPASRGNKPRTGLVGADATIQILLRSIDGASAGASAAARRP
jgi:hypothetical protein